MELKPVGSSAFISWLICSLALSAALAVPAHADNARALPKPNWDQAAALQAVADSDQLLGHQANLSVWLQQIDGGDALHVLNAVQHSDQAGKPAFEAQLFDLAVALAEAPLEAAVDELLLWLADYPSQVLVAHEESADYGIALYPVAAAALGATSERQRRRGQILSRNLLSRNPSLWLQGYLAASHTEQQGFVQSLQVASIESIQSLAVEIQQQLPKHPELASPAGAVASILSDESLFLNAYQYSQGADSAALLREANWRLDAAERSDLLASIMALPSTEKAALGISMLAPGLQTNPAVSASLLGLLDDPQLGAAAALALAGHPDPQVQSQLHNMLKTGGLKAQRAALALDQSISPEATGDPQ